MGLQIIPEARRMLWDYLVECTHDRMDARVEKSLENMDLTFFKLTTNILWGIQILINSSAHEFVII